MIKGLPRLEDRKYIARFGGRWPLTDSNPDDNGVMLAFLAWGNGRHTTMPSTISLGSTGDDVKRLQRALARQLLWNPFGPITGVFDATLENDVKSFQSANGLAPDGIVGPATWTALPAYREASPELKVGSKGPAVAWLQKALGGTVGGTELPNVYSGAIDGIFGPKTDAAVRAVQKWAGQPETGIVDDNTWFIWVAPGTAHQATLEVTCNLTTGLIA